MSGILLVVIVFFVLVTVLGAVAFWVYRRKLRRAKAIERGLKMVPLLIHLPPPSDDTEMGSRDVRDVMREKTAQAEVLYNLIAGTATSGFKSNFYGQRHIALELVASDGLVHFYAAVPVALVSVVKQAILTAYPGARLEEVEDHNIFNQEGRLAATMGGELSLKNDAGLPIATYVGLERDPMEAILTTLGALKKDDGAAIQIMLRPATTRWTKHSAVLAAKKRKSRHAGLDFTAGDLAKAAVKAPSERRQEQKEDVSKLELEAAESIEEKTKHPGFEVLIRVVVSTPSVARSQNLLRDLATSFALFEAPGLNGFKFLAAAEVQGLVTAFIFRFFPPELTHDVLNSVELATVFHLPDAQFTPTMNVERQQFTQIDGPVSLPTTGLLFGYNEFRGTKKEIRLSAEDRRRHTYIIGQTGTGKSTMLENLILQDMKMGNGFAVIDPHGDLAEKMLGLVPKERAEDVVYFNPADTNYPMGLNLFEFDDPTQKDFLVQESIEMLYKLYDPNKTGMIGARFENWYRNAALTLMSDPNGSTFIEIPKVFTDTDYLKQKFRYLQDQTVIEFWTKEMAQTSDYHKSEMLGWFVSKFGAFLNNEMMRNIIGQTKSSFDLRDIMDNQKILIVNLSKGRVGELNSKLLGMIFVMKFQQAAMSRASMLESERKDFCLYVDEFQNFATDSFATILSEARKYRLNLIVANQFIGQLMPEIRDAVFGNIGSIIAHRVGPEDAEFMTKQFAPVFEARDLVNIPNLQSAVRLMVGGLPSQPFTMQDLPWVTGVNRELGLAVEQLSAAKFGRSKSVVDSEINSRLFGKAAPAPAPATAPPPPAPTPAPVAPAPEPVAEKPAAEPLAPAPAPVAEKAAPVPPAAPEPPVASTPPEEKPAVVDEPEPVAAPAPVAEERPAAPITHMASDEPALVKTAAATALPDVPLLKTPAPASAPAEDTGTLSIKDIRRKPLLAAPVEEPAATPVAPEPSVPEAVAAAEAPAPEPAVTAEETPISAVASEPTEADATQTAESADQPTTGSAAGNYVAEAQHEIDELLSTSLIKPERRHARMPEVAESTPVADQAEEEASPEVAPPTAEDAHAVPHKVIQPLDEVALSSVPGEPTPAAMPAEESPASVEPSAKDDAASAKDAAAAELASEPTAEAAPETTPSTQPLTSRDNHSVEHATGVPEPSAASTPVSVTETTAPAPEAPAESIMATAEPTAESASPAEVMPATASSEAAASPEPTSEPAPEVTPAAEVPAPADPVAEVATPVTTEPTSETVAPATSTLDVPSVDEPAPEMAAASAATPDQYEPAEAEASPLIGHFASTETSREADAAASVVHEDPAAVAPDEETDTPPGPDASAIDQQLQSASDALINGAAQDGGLASSGTPAQAGVMAALSGAPSPEVASSIAPEPEPAASASDAVASAEVTPADPDAAAGAVGQVIMPASDTTGQPMAAVAASPQTPPKLAPGEVFVAEDGTVYQG